jgi:hypothetical protein
MAFHDTPVHLLNFIIGLGAGSHVRIIERMCIISPIADLSASVDIPKSCIKS